MGAVPRGRLTPWRVLRPLVLRGAPRRARPRRATWGSVGASRELARYGAQGARVRPAPSDSARRARGTIGAPRLPWFVVCAASQGGLRPRHACAGAVGRSSMVATSCGQRDGAWPRRPPAPRDSSCDCEVETIRNPSPQHAPGPMRGPRAERHRAELRGQRAPSPLRPPIRMGREGHGSEAHARAAGEPASRDERAVHRVRAEGEAGCFAYSHTHAASRRRWWEGSGLLLLHTARIIGRGSAVVPPFPLQGVAASDRLLRRVWAWKSAWLT